MARKLYEFPALTKVDYFCGAKWAVPVCLSNPQVRSCNINVKQRGGTVSRQDAFFEMTMVSCILQKLEVSYTASVFSARVVGYGASAC
eukprot:574804-Pyramimonas_sp.AAC.1